MFNCNWKHRGTETDTHTHEREREEGGGGEAECESARDCVSGKGGNAAQDIGEKIGDQVFIPADMGMKVYPETAGESPRAGVARPGDGSPVSLAGRSKVMCSKSKSSSGGMIIRSSSSSPATLQPACSYRGSYTLTVTIWHNRTGYSKEQHHRDSCRLRTHNNLKSTVTARTRQQLLAHDHTTARPK